VLKRIGLGKLGRLPPPEPIRRYFGELICIDVRKLGGISAKGAGHGVTGKRNHPDQAREDGTSGWWRATPSGDDTAPSVTDRR